MRRVFGGGGAIDPLPLLDVLEGSETIVVDLNETDNKVEFHLDQDVVDALLPEGTPSDYGKVPQLTPSGARWTSMVKLYRHILSIHGDTGTFSGLNVITNRAEDYETWTDLLGIVNSTSSIAIWNNPSNCFGFTQTAKYYFKHLREQLDIETFDYTVTVEYVNLGNSEPTIVSDTVIEI